jgi:hypothetical protein
MALIFHKDAPPTLLLPYLGMRKEHGLVAPASRRRFTPIEMQNRQRDAGATEPRAPRQVWTRC